MKSQKVIVIISFLFLIFACKQEGKEIEKSTSVTSIKFAKGFEIQKFTDYKKLVINSPYPNAKKALEYILIPKGKEIPAIVKGKKIIRTPIEKIVVTSTTHIPFLELLDVEKSLVGFPSLKYISSTKTRQLISNGQIKELGNGQDINTEVLLDLQPELVIGFAMNSNPKMFTNIEKAGIPVVFNGDWLEETPLGRAEWLKFFAVLFEKEQVADSIFNRIEKEYNDAVIIAKKVSTKPTILTGSIFKDIWNLPAGDSFMAQYLKDANTDYLWANTKGRGSLSLSFESVFEKGKNTDFWIDSGIYTSFKELEETNQHYAKFKAFKTKKIFSFAHQKGENGGLLYYELAPVQPNIVLKDIIKAVHPELLPEYEPYFLKRLK